MLGLPGNSSTLTVGIVRDKGTIRRLFVFEKTANLALEDGLCISNYIYVKPEKLPSSHVPTMISTLSLVLVVNRATLRYHLCADLSHVSNEVHKICMRLETVDET